MTDSCIYLRALRKMDIPRSDGLERNYSIEGNINTDGQAGLISPQGSRGTAELQSRKSALGMPTHSHLSFQAAMRCQSWSTVPWKSARSSGLLCIKIPRAQQFRTSQRSQAKFPK